MEVPQVDALNWLLELELVNTPYVLNSLILNTVSQVKGIENVELVIDEREKKMLIFVKLTWFYNKFRRERTEMEVMNLVDSVLPSFKKRVTSNREILDRALKIVETR